MAISFLKNNIVQYKDKLYLWCHWLENIAVEHHTKLIWTLGIIYKFSLDAMYIWAASPLYNYAGLVYQPNGIKYIIGSLMYFIIFSCLPKTENELASFWLNLQFIFMVSPLISFYALANQSNKYILMVFISFLIEIYIVKRSKGKNGDYIYIKGIKSYLTVFLIILTIITLIVPILYNGFAGYKAFDLSYIYVMRENPEYPAGFGYVQGWITKAVLPFFIAYCLDKKQYNLTILGMLVMLLFYMESGHKVLFLSLFVVLFVFLISKLGHTVKLMYLGFIGIFLLTIVLYRFDSASKNSFGVYLNSFVGVRAIFHPADNKFNFYELFSQYPKTYFSDGLIGKMLSLTYPYKGSLGQVVSASLGNEFMKANFNTGYLGESYAQMGFLGMILMSLLLGYMIRFLQNNISSKKTSVIFSTFALYVIFLNDGALFTLLFSGGIFISVILSFIYLNKKMEDKDGI